MYKEKPKCRKKAMATNPVKYDEKRVIEDLLHAKKVEFYADNVALDGLHVTVENLLSDICNKPIKAKDVKLINVDEYINIKAVLENGLIVYFEDVEPNDGYCTYYLRVRNK